MVTDVDMQVVYLYLAFRNIIQYHGNSEMERFKLEIEKKERKNERNEPSPQIAT